MLRAIGSTRDRIDLIRLRNAKPLAASGLILASFLTARAAEPPVGLRETIPALAHCEQIILVTAADWNTSEGGLQLFERARRAKAWRAVGPKVPVTLGRAGLAWGIGLHGSQPGNTPPKREGDQRSPAGVFAMDKIYALDATTAKFRFPVAALQETSEGVDDPRSRFYNRVVDATRVNGRDWVSSEKLRPGNPLFRWLVVVKHNWQPFAGYGSCIYLHVWKSPHAPTSGCTALEHDSLARLVHWLDVARNPLLIQLPRAEYEHLKSPWSLP